MSPASEAKLAGDIEALRLQPSICVMVTEIGTMGVSSFRQTLKQGE
jgi:hypothetical protein